MNLVHDLRALGHRFDDLAAPRAAASLGDVLTLTTARRDGVAIPVATGHHPNASSPSKIDRIYAERVAALPVRNEKGHYEETSPVVTSAAELSDFIRDRTASWKLHLQRQSSGGRARRLRMRWRKARGDIGQLGIKGRIPPIARSAATIRRVSEAYAPACFRR